MIQFLIIIFFSSLIIQLLFWILRFSHLVFYQSKIKKERESNAGVSVVICAHNEQQNLQELLPLLIKQDYQNFEVIIVNDRSDDDSGTLLKEFTQLHSRLKFIDVVSKPAHFQGKKYALTTGIKEAANEIILLTDADCRPASTHWIQSMANAFSENVDIVLGYSQYESRQGVLNQFIRFETLYTGIQYLSFALAGQPYMGVGRNLAYRKSLFMNNEGFSGYEGIVGGDDDLFVNKHAHAQNTAIAIGQNALVYSIPKQSWRELYFQKLRHLNVGKFYNTINKTTLAFLSLSHILFWFSFITLAIVTKEPMLAVYGVLIRVFLIIITFIPSSKKLEKKGKHWNLVVMDLLYVAYYLTIGISAIFSKKVKWI